MWRHKSVSKGDGFWIKIGTILRRQGDMCLKCDLRDKDRRDCLGEQDYFLRRGVMMKRPWICLNLSAKVIWPMFSFPSHMGKAACNPFYFQSFPSCRKQAQGQERQCLVRFWLLPATQCTTRVHILNRALSPIEAWGLAFPVPEGRGRSLLPWVNDSRMVCKVPHAQSIPMFISKMHKCIM